MPPPSSLPRCVIADDVRASRHLLQHCLTRTGLQVDACRDGLAAWEVIQRSLQEVVPALIITDIEMPKMTGLELLRCVKESDDRRLRRIPVILMTSLLDNEISDLVDDYAAATILMKPLSEQATCEVVKRLLRGETVAAVHDSNSSLSNHSDHQLISPTLRRLLRQTRT